MDLKNLDETTLDEIIRSRFVVGMGAGGAGEGERGAQGIVLMAAIELMRRTAARQGAQVIALSEQMVESSTALRRVTEDVAARNAEMTTTTTQLVRVTEGMDATNIQGMKQNTKQTMFMNRMTVANLVLAALACLAALWSVVHPSSAP